MIYNVLKVAWASYESVKMTEVNENTGRVRNRYNKENVGRIGNKVGRCIRVEEDQIMRQHTYLRVQVEVNAKAPIQAGLWWMNHKGKDKWTTIKYERLSNYCYGCGRLGHTSQNYNDKVIMS